jgi:hypothetical protein
VRGCHTTTEGDSEVDHVLDLTAHWIGVTALATFLVAYGAVMAEGYLF